MALIRMVQPNDLEYLEGVLDSIELFPSEMLEDMIASYLHQEDSPEIWFTAIQDQEPVAIGFCAPEQLTDGTYNLYAIGVRKELQGQGLGGQMMGFIEQHLKDQGHRILIVETSGKDEFKLTRSFYEQLDYTKEATVRDFWAEGDDKVIYWKRLN